MLSRDLLLHSGLRMNVLAASFTALGAAEGLGLTGLVAAPDVVDVRYILCSLLFVFVMACVCCVCLCVYANV